VLISPLRSRLSSMIGGCAKTLGAPPLLPMLPGRRVAPASCAAEPAALAPATEGPPAHADTGAAQRPEESAPAPSSSPSPKLHVSAALSRWSRGRALRSGRRLSRSALSAATVTKPPPSLPVTLEDGLPMAGEDDGDVCLAERVAATGKTIYMVSDGTGETAEHAVRAALGQFEDCLVDHKCSVNTHLFSGVKHLPLTRCHLSLRCWRSMLC
jgi:[pyruvate, phosphate dikinase]-phosphate phosphotransferase / [pyruvate, phosphate dikinase] kinase